MKNIVPALFLLLPFALRASPGIPDTLCLFSDILGENRTVLIFQPSSSGAEDSLCLFILTDGEYAFSRLNEGRESNPEMPLLGMAILNTDRRRDLLYVNEADRFLEFIEKELIPRVEEMYKINKRILYGHSFGGSFSLYAFLIKPGLFDGIIASSPLPVQDLSDPEKYHQADRQLNHPAGLYISRGSLDLKSVRKGCSRLSESLSRESFDKLSLFMEEYEGENHTSAAFRSVNRGLEMLLPPRHSNAE